MNEGKARHQNICRRVFLNGGVRKFRRGEKNGDEIFVLAGSSERYSEILYREKVRRKSRDRNGFYIGLGTNLYYDADSGTIDGRRVFLISSTNRQMQDRWKRRQAEEKLLERARKASSDHCVALADLVLEKVGKPALWLRQKEGALGAIQTLETLIGSLSLSDLKGLLDLSR